jgi:DNA ligase-1
MTTPSEFRHFATTCDLARATTKKLEKTTTIANYLRTLGAIDVGIAARFLAAQPFTPSSSISLGVGGALVVDAVRSIDQIEANLLHEAFRKHGEIGEAVSAHWPQLPTEATPLTLAEIQSAFKELSTIGHQETKRQLLLDLLRRTTDREAAYLIKIILGDMRTGVSAGVIEAAIAEAFGASLADVRSARLLVGDLDKVAELALAGRLAHAEFRPFIPMGYMLAQPMMTAAEIIETLGGRPAVAEDKYDGIRAQLHVALHDGKIRAELYSRGSGAVSASFPDIITPALTFASAAGKQFVLDGEIVPMRIVDGQPGGAEILPFSILQRRLGRKQLSPAQLRQNPVAFLAFDCLWLDGTLLLNQPFAQRRHKLHELQKGTPSVSEGPGATPPTPTPPFVLGPSTVVTTPSALEDLFKQARNRRNEGLVIKRLDSPYTPGRRGDAWMKLKSHLPTLDVVVVGAEKGHGKRKDVLSDVTFAVRTAEDSDQLLTIGKAYTGLTDAEIAQLTQRFIAETLEESGRYRRVQPTVVLEVAFDQITKSTRHSSGYAMRFPRIVRIRTDKSAAEIDTMQTVENIYNSPDNLAVDLLGEKRAEEPPNPQLPLFEV